MRALFSDQIEMNCSEVEFIAEDERIRIVPNFNHERIHLISGDVGPFEAGISLEVPIWLGIYFKRRQKCQILPPEWLNVATLESVKKAEVDQSVFTPMPSEHYMEVSHLLITNAPAEIPDGDEVKSLIKDIWDVRMAKLRTSLNIFITEERTVAKVNNLTQFEICQIRRFLTASLDHLHSLQTAMQNVGILTSSQSQ